MIKLPERVNLDDLLQFLRKIGLQSSALLRDFDNGTIPLYDQSEGSKINLHDKDPVTLADLTLNKYFVSEFLENFPNIDWDIVTEENSKGNIFKESNCEWVWYIDPLDGTKDFIQKSGEYAIHIGLTYRNKAILGMVLLPSIYEMWFGVKGIGTWKENDNCPLKTINSDIVNKQIVSFSKSEVFSVVTSKNHNNQRLELILKEMGYKNITRMGSIGFKVCSLLRNDADIYISISGKTSPKDWDIAAPFALIKNASCNFTYVTGDDIYFQRKDYLQEGCLIASTLRTDVHLSICKEVSEIIKNN